MWPLYANWITTYVKVREKRNSGRNVQRPLIDNLAGLSATDNNNNNNSVFIIIIIIVWTEVGL